jgi:hypothetical protein
VTAERRAMRMTEDTDLHLRLLVEDLFGHASFREGQLPSLRQALRGGDSVVLLPTGTGKSLIYQLAGLLMPGTTLVVDPLVSLIDDQEGRLLSDGIDRVMRAALADGATGVVWVTLREKTQYGGIYRSTNRGIRNAAKRWPQLVVADWNAYSAGKPWFRSDGLHLTALGAVELAKFLRPYVFRAAALHS